MQVHTIASPAIPDPGNYAAATELSSPSRLVFISGQIPETPDGHCPADFEAQCRIAWANVEAVLGSAGMTLGNLVKVTIFLSDRKYRAVNARIREEVLGSHDVALTVVITGIYESRWLLEIEAVAAA